MYACFLWATVGTLLATLNFVLTLCICPVLTVMVQIKHEEGVLVELFGREYAEYSQDVSALAFPWGCCCCFGVDSAGGRVQR